MTSFPKVWLFLLRISLGWLFFYAGITKILNPAWSAEGYLSNAKTLGGFYGWLASDGLLPLTNFVNEWGLTLIGAALFVGIFVRIAGIAGAAMMLLYYLPALDFPYPNEHSFLVDEHIVYALALLVLASFEAGSVWGAGQWVKLKGWMR